MFLPSSLQSCSLPANFTFHTSPFNTPPALAPCSSCCLLPNRPLFTTNTLSILRHPAFIQSPFFLRSYTLHCSLYIASLNHPSTLPRPPGVLRFSIIQSIYKYYPFILSLTPPIPSCPYSTTSSPCLLLQFYTIHCPFYHLILYSLLCQYYCFFTFLYPPSSLVFCNPVTERCP